MFTALVLAVIGLGAVLGFQAAKRPGGSSPTSPAAPNTPGPDFIGGLGSALEDFFQFDQLSGRLQHLFQGLRDFPNLPLPGTVPTPGQKPPQTPAGAPLYTEPTEEREDWAEFGTPGRMI